MAARIFWTQGMSSVTRAYTPGVEVEQVLLPQDTIPTRVQALFFRQTRGPPESPCKSKEMKGVARALAYPDPAESGAVQRSDKCGLSGRA